MKVAFIIIVVIFALSQQTAYCRSDATKNLPNQLKCIIDLLDNLEQHVEELKEFVLDLIERLKNLQALRDYCDSLKSDPPKPIEEIYFKVCETAFNAKLLVEVTLLMAELEQLKIEQPELLTRYWNDFASCIA